jgi:arginine-tRNA-protein transferase
MKEFSSETGQQYDTYTFGYAQYARKESGDMLGDMYGQGYLPYSGSPDVTDIFYRARSARVVLQGFALTSENRRIAKKFDGSFQKIRTPLASFKADDSFSQFCLSYFAGLHGTQAMPKTRLSHILRCGLITSVITYTKEDVPVAYVVEVADASVGHYWFSFYDLAYARQSLGMWLMLDNIRDAKERKLSHYYLGTVYGEKALYKTNFEPLEWWDGEGWNTAVVALKERSRSDASRALQNTDLWKSTLPPFA